MGGGEVGAGAGQSQDVGEIERVSQPGRHNHERPALHDALIEHVHGPEIESDRVFAVALRRLDKLVGDLGFCRCEEDARLAFALGLRLA